MDAALAASREAFFAILKEDPDSKALESEYPGIYQDVWKAMEPVILKSVDDDMPKLWNRLARLYTERLTPAEIAGLRRFYATPTGQRMVRTMDEEADLAPMVEAITKSPDAPITTEVMRKSLAPARAAVVRQITPQDEAALTGLQKSISLPKLYALGAQVQRVTLEWMNEPDPEFDARLDALIEKRMERFMAEADAKK